MLLTWWPLNFRIPWLCLSCYVELDAELQACKGPFCELPGSTIVITTSHACDGSRPK